jgi:signal transduction histidine kinase
VTLYQALPLIQGIFTLTLFLLVAKHDWHRAVSRLLLLFLGALALWGFTVAGMRLTSDLGKALWWERTTLIMVGFTAASFYLFVTEYIGLGRRQIRRLAILFLLATVAIAPTSLLARGMGRDRYGNAPVWGSLFSVWVLFTYALVIMAAVYLERARRVSTSYEERNRYLYFILGAIISILGAGADALSAAGVPIYPMAIPANILFACITTVAIVKYHLLDIRVTLRQGAVYILAGSMTAAPLIAVAALWLWLTHGRDISGWWLLPPLFGIALFLGPLWRRSLELLKKRFYGERYDYLRALERFSEQSRGINNMNKLCSLIIDLADKTLQPSHVCLFVSSEHGDFNMAASIRMSQSEPFTLNADTLISWFKRSDVPLWHRDLDLIPLLQAMSAEERIVLNSLGAELYSFIATESQPIGIMALGPKQHGQLYTREDLQMLHALSREAALNLENVRLLELERDRVLRLQQLEQMKSEFLFAVSHQLKTPLTSIKVAADILADPDKQVSNGFHQRLLSTISHSTKDLDTYITTILDFARIENATLELKCELMDIRDVIKDVAKMIEPQIRLKEQSLELFLADSMAQVTVDRQRFKQILTILLENAHKFTPRGGCISVRHQQDDASIYMEVRDSGPGVPLEEQQKIFEAYYQSKSQRPRDADGLGLGLAVAKKLVELHGGQIWVESRPGEGATFFFTLPARAAAK